MNVQNCCCIPCTSTHLVTPPLTAVGSRIQEIDRGVWQIIFHNLQGRDLGAAAATCKKWRFIISRGFGGNQPCFKAFYNDILRSRHVVILDVTGSMYPYVEKSQEMALKLINLLEPSIKKRGIFVGNLGVDFGDVLEHVKTKEKAIDYFSHLRLGRGLSSLRWLSLMMYEKLGALDSKVNTHVHFITDMGLDNTEMLYRTNFFQQYKSKIIYHFKCLEQRGEIQQIKDWYEEIKDEEIPLKRQKTKKVSEALEFNFQIK